MLTIDVPCRVRVNPCALSSAYSFFESDFESLETQHSPRAYAILTNHTREVKIPRNDWDRSACPEFLSIMYLILMLNFNTLKFNFK